MDEEMPVIFRKYNAQHGGEVIAIFPAEANSNDASECTSYVHVGQHGTCNPVLVVQNTRPATPKEFADLKRELESSPYWYRLKLYQRLNREFFLLRRKQIATLRG